jgi:ParB family chromosome partitioning protein
MLDLTALDNASTSVLHDPGEPPKMRLDLIEEDPDQPRKRFGKKAMDELISSVKQFGVTEPIGIRPHPTKPGYWMIVKGARRYRAALAAGLVEIPYYLSDTNDERVRRYHQAIENIQRENLSPMDIGLFIQYEIANGDSKAQIARDLGKDASYVTHHLALVDAPELIKQLYENDRCTSPKTLYDLRKLYDKNPEVVQDWYERAIKLGFTVDRFEVTKLADEIAYVDRQPREPISSPAVQTNTEETVLTNSVQGQQEPELAADISIAPQAVTEVPSPQVISDSGKQTAEKEPAEPGAVQVPFHNPKIEQEQTKPKPTGMAIKKPLLLVENKSRAAMVLLHRQPSAPGLVYVRYEDNGDDEEVDAGLLKITLLCQASK